MRSAPHAPVVIVAGPTASGKSALALALAEEFAGTLINADSMQVYRDLAVLTARPGRDELARAPHELYGVVDAAEACSAGRWLNLARAAIERARGAGRLPILVGGTGLYLRALTRGLAPIPDIPAEIRRAAGELHAQLGGELFHAALASLDAETASRLAPSDTQRLIRAYEVVQATGRSITAWQGGGREIPDLSAMAIVLLPPRDVLYAACDARFSLMMERGAVAEVEALLARRLDRALPAMKAVGVPELAAYIAGKMSREAAIAAAQQATRRYAKRQYTWLRHQMPETSSLRKTTLSEQFSESLVPRLFSFIRQFLLTGYN